MSSIDLNNMHFTFTGSVIVRFYNDFQAKFYLELLSFIFNCVFFDKCK